MVGSAGKFNSIYTISVRLINAETGLNIRSADFDHEGDINTLYQEGIKKIAIELSGKRSLIKKYEKEQKENERVEK